ncbi:hypothetical protein [Hyunsoonleella ulvae]|uniref:hypothetical protein n=1 Tax=Hyunsoonleella ulvae TaxID=2799948 RepID=UPI00193A8035|nr:hypothetical protein [Hyunsoonleella ulvae]
MTDLRLELITKEKLEIALEQNLYWGFSNKMVPFSKSKAKWLLQNERFEANDICGVMGLEKEEIVSFVYLIPDLIKTKNGIEKVFWSSRWWVCDKYKDSVLSAYTKKASTDAAKEKVIIKYLGADTLEYYKKQPYTEFSERTRYIFMFNLDDGLLTSKLKMLKFISPVLKGIKWISHYSITKLNRLKFNLNGVSYEYISYINEKNWEFIAPFVKNDLVFKTKNYINWQINNNQYTNAPLNHKNNYTCLISSISNKIHNNSLMVYLDHQLIGFISFLIRGNEFVTRYFLCSEKNYKFCADTLMEHFIKSKCTFLLTEDENLGKYIKNSFTSVYVNKRNIVSVYNNSLGFDLKNEFVYQQDGHFA